MENNGQPAGSKPPPKPWELTGTSSGPAPFKPPSSGNTSNIVEASGTAKPGEVVATAVNRTTPARSMPTRPWEQTYRSNYGGYGSGMYGSYGGGMYGNMYRGGYGGGMYGGNMYNSGIGVPIGGYGMGMGGPNGNQDPNNPFGAPSSPPSFWISLMRVIQGAVNFFGRIAMLIDQNTQAFHMFMTALLQLCDRSGLLYGELARFVLRLLGIRTKPKRVDSAGQPGLPAPPSNPQVNQNHTEGSKPPPGGAWDNLWRG